MCALHQNFKVFRQKTTSLRVWGFVIELFWSLHRSEIVVSPHLPLRPCPLRYFEFQQKLSCRACACWCGWGEPPLPSLSVLHSPTSYGTFSQFPWLNFWGYGECTSVTTWHLWICASMHEIIYKVGLNEKEPSGALVNWRRRPQMSLVPHFLQTLL